MRIFENYNLLAHNTFGIEARCRQFVEITTVEEATTCLPALSNQQFLIIGGGSNLLLTRDYDGTVIRSAIEGIDIEECSDGVLVKCGSGVVWDDVVAFCVEHGYHGAENLSLIPGDVGASAVQNIGAYGSEVKDLIQSVEAVEIATGKICVFGVDELHYSYRHSIFKSDWKNRFFITHVTYKLSRSFQPRLDYGNIRSALEARQITDVTAAQLRDTIIDIRQSKLPDPKVLGNAGSFFMNPVVDRSCFESLLEQYPDMPHYHVDDEYEKIPAGWMIDQCGWKGKSLGRAGVHDKQALVLINKGGASGEEIVNLCRTIQQDVKKRFGVEIHPEVNII